MIFWSVFCAITGLGFLSESVGLFAHELNLAFAIFFFLLSALFACFTKFDNAGKNNHLMFASGLGTMAIGFLLLPSGWNVRIFAAALWFLGLDMSLKARGARPFFLIPLGTGCVIFGLFEWLSGTSLLCWYLVQSLSRSFSAFAGSLVEQKSLLGTSFSGIGMIVLTIGIMLCGFMISEKKLQAVLYFIFALLAEVFFYFVYLCRFALLSAKYLAPDGEAMEEVSLFIPLLLPLFLSVPVGIYLWKLVPLPGLFQGEIIKEGKSRKVVTIIVVAAVSFFSVAALTNLTGGENRGVKQVALYKKGFLNWLSPTKKRYGKYSAGMFGELPVHLQSMGWKSELIEEINKNTLKGKDILVIINQDKELPTESLKDIKDFVLEGGALLVLGDHTFWKEKKRLLINDPIEFSAIRFKFDSADFFIGGWLHSYRFWPHAISLGLGDHTNEPGSVVGASLDIHYPATPILIGRYGYSDPGDLKAKRRGYLGNLNFDPGEMLGDVVLAAAENVGKGRIFVVGDTSSFSNMIQARTWPYVNRVFYWLGSNGRATVSTWRDWLGILLVISVLFFLFACVKNNTLAVVTTAGCFFAFAWTSNQAIRVIGKPPPLKGRVAIVDFSHLGRFSLEGWHDNAVDGVFLNLMREKYFTIGTKKFDRDQVLASDVFVTVAPTVPYSSSELETLKLFMENGGTILLTVGWEERAGAQSLLDMVGFKIPAIPLGRATGSGSPFNEQPIFYEAWPVEGGQPLIFVDGKPVITQKKIGKGKIVVIGDSQFLQNKNFEMEGGGIFRNIRLFYWLLSGTPGKKQ